MPPMALDLLNAQVIKRLLLTLNRDFSLWSWFLKCIKIVDPVHTKTTLYTQELNQIDEIFRKQHCML